MKKIQLIWFNVKDSDHVTLMWLAQITPISTFPSWHQTISFLAKDDFNQSPEQIIQNQACLVLYHWTINQKIAFVKFWNNAHLSESTGRPVELLINILRDLCWYVENVPFTSLQFVNRWPAKQIHKIHKIPAAAVSFVHKHRNFPCGHSTRIKILDVVRNLGTAIDLDWEEIWWLMRANTMKISCDCQRK